MCIRDRIELSLYWMCKFTESCREAEGLVTRVEVETDGEIATDRIFLTLAESGDYYQALALDLLCRAPIMPANIWCGGKEMCIRDSLGALLYVNLG